MSRLHAAVAEARRARALPSAEAGVPWCAGQSVHSLDAAVQSPLARQLAREVE